MSEDEFDDAFYSYCDNCGKLHGAGHHRHGFTESPTSGYHGVQWYERKVYVVGARACVNTVIHEMGHVFAEHRSPQLCEEWRWLGWEIALARLVRGYKQWSRDNVYTLGDLDREASNDALGFGLEWHDLEPAGERLVVRDRLEAV